MSSKTLIIVESPHKAEKIQEFLGNNYIVLASKGHIADLAKGGKWGMGIDLKNNFRPHYMLLNDKIKVLESILEAAEKVDNILLLSDPDREGEAIAWHVMQRLDGVNKPIKRITVNEITKKAILEAIKNPRDLDMNLVKAQEARRFLDRIVGFTVSPFLINFFGPNLSAGRVQSVAARIIIDREEEIETFKPEEYWTINSVFHNLQNEKFTAKYEGKLSTKKDVDTILNQINGIDFKVSNIESKEELRKPNPPLITTKLQQVMSKSFGMSSDRTMKAAQWLYENGFCSYIRTDSTRISDEALKDCRDWLKSNNYSIPKKPNLYVAKNSAADAHECIRPTDVNITPSNCKEIITPDEKKVYEIIWKYFVASQMESAIYNTLKVKVTPVNNSNIEFKSSGKSLKSKGFLEIMGINDDSKIDIPNLIKNEKVIIKDPKDILSEQKFTQPPSRYSESSFIKELENKEIGRPATVAEIISKIQLRNYVEKKNNIFYPTELGKKVNKILKDIFNFVEINYSAKLEKQLDLIADGKLNYLDMLNLFYNDFNNQLIEGYKKQGSLLCECGSPKKLLNGKYGKFYVCLNNHKKSLDASDI